MTTYRIRVTSKRESGNLIEWEGVDVDAAAFVPTGTAAPVNPSGQVVRLPGKTQIIAADLPPLREQDFGSTGYYGAGAPLTPAGWTGAAIWRKPDGAADYAPEITIEVAATMGGVLNALHQHGFYLLEDYQFAGWYTDNCGYIDVALTSGTLSSVTHDEFMNLEQVALVGEEIIAFRDAELIETNVYRLRTFLRGLQATEWFARIPEQVVPYNILQSGGTVTEFSAEAVEGHAAGDRFLLLMLNGGIRRFVPDGSTTPVRGMVRGITRGASVDVAGESYMPQTWASIVPPHPSNVTAWRTNTSEITVGFEPRSFIGTGREIGIDPDISADRQHLITAAGPEGSMQVYVTGDPPFVINDSRLSTYADGTHLRVDVRAIPAQFPSTTSPVFEAGSGWRVNGNPLQIRYASPRRHIAPAVRVSFA